MLGRQNASQMRQQACCCRLLAHTCMVLILLSCVQVPRCPAVLRVASAANSQLLRPGTMTGGPCDSAERKSTSALQDGNPQAPEQEASCQVCYCGFSVRHVIPHLYTRFTGSRSEMPLLHVESLLSRGWPVSGL